MNTHAFSGRIIMALLICMFSSLGSGMSDAQSEACSQGHFLVTVYRGQFAERTGIQTCVEGPGINHEWSGATEESGPIDCGRCDVVGGSNPLNKLTGQINFSVEWVGYFNFREGRYAFTAGSDDGIRVWLDDQLILSEWKSRSYSQRTLNIPISRGAHKIAVQYYQNRGSARIYVNWSPR